MHTLRTAVAMAQTLVKECMSANVVTIGPDATLPEAHRVMRDKDIRRLLVVEGGNRLIGILSMTDVYEAGPSDATSLSVWEMNYLLAKTHVREIMTSDPKTIGSDDTMANAARIMLENKFGALPVVDDSKKAIGIVTQSDIFKMVAEGAEK